MRGISTLNLLLKGSVFAAALTAGSFNAFSQEKCTINTTIDCPVQATYTFENLLPGSTGGFSGGDFVYSGPQANSSGGTSLETIPPLTDPKILITPGFKLPSGATDIDYTFELGGTGRVISFDVYIIREDGSEFFLCSDLTPTYQGAAYSKVCVNSPIPQSANVFDQTVKLKFVFTAIAASGSIENKTITFDNFGLFSGTAQIILPVNFIAFTAKSVAKGTQLGWNVADEVNVSRYEVQKGADGGSFKTIGIVFAGEKSSYSFTDEQPSQGVSFYRIRSVDADGKYKFSTVISFSNGKTVSLLRAYPMPARNQVTLQHGAIEGKAQITISSESGQIMKRVVPAVGSMQTAIDLSALKAGMYLLRLENSNGEVETLKVVKQ